MVDKYRESLLTDGREALLIEIGALIYHPVCAAEERGRFLYGAATPPVQEGKFGLTLRQLL